MSAAPPLREAIRILAQEGLVQLRPARSPVVADPSQKQVTDDLTVMSMLEKLSGELACTAATDAEIDAIAEIHHRMAHDIDSRDPVEQFEMDMAFHRSIALASHNHALADTHGEYLARLWRTRYLTSRQRRNRERVITQHARILAALQSRDRQAIGGAIGTHLDGFFDSIGTLFAERAQAGAR